MRANIPHDSLSRPQKVVHFRGSLTVSHIRGQWFPSMKDGAFVVIWGRSGQCFAYLHDFDLASRNYLIEQCKRCVDSAEYPHATPTWLQQCQSV